MTLGLKKLVCQIAAEEEKLVRRLPQGRGPYLWSPSQLLIPGWGDLSFANPERVKQLPATQAETFGKL